MDVSSKSTVMGTVIEIVKWVAGRGAQEMHFGRFKQFYIVGPVI